MEFITLNIPAVKSHVAYHSLESMISNVLIFGHIINGDSPFLPVSYVINVSFVIKLL